MKLFDILTNISTSNDDISGNPEFKKNFAPYIINKFLSSSPSCTFQIDNMNRLSHLPLKLQYLYLLYSIPNKYRKFNFLKKEVEENAVIMKHFNCRSEIAKTYRKFLHDEDITKMKKMYDME